MRVVLNAAKARWKAQKSLSSFRMTALHSLPEPRRRKRQRGFSSAGQLLTRTVSGGWLSPTKRIAKIVSLPAGLSIPVIRGSLKRATG